MQGPAKTLSCQRSPFLGRGGKATLGKEDSTLLLPIFIIQDSTRLLDSRTVFDLLGEREAANLMGACASDEIDPAVSGEKRKYE